MIVVRVELWSAITGRKTELARLIIANEGTSENPRRGDYTAAALRGRDAETLQANTVAWVMNRKGAAHTGEVKNHARLQEHVWVLVTKALKACGYDK